MDLDALPPSIASRIQKLERQVEILQRSNKLIVSTLVGGQFRILDSAGDEIVAIGELSTGVNGFRVYVEGGTNLSILRVDQVNGFTKPWLSTGWRPYEDTDVTHSTEGYGEVTGSTFRRLWRTTTELLLSTEILFRVIVTCPAATTGELRLWHRNPNTVLGATLSVPASTTAETYEYRISHGAVLDTGPHHFYLEGRNASGAGPLKVYEPAPMHYGAYMSTVAGGWV